jgi:transcriptional regulator with XRE-family HTH domain
LSWSTYVRSVAGDASLDAIARRAQVDRATVWAWQAGKRTPSADAAIRFARRHGRNPIQALAAAGFITEAEADVREADTADLTTDDLLAEIARRTGGSVVA